MPDLTLARATAESVMDATCTITSDPEGVTDDVFDETTGRYTPPNPDTTTVYSGKCMIRPSTLGQNERVEGGAEQFIDRYDVRLPVTATGVQPGMVLTVNTTPSDPDLVGRTFTVIQIAAGTFSVTRILTVQARKTGPRV